MPVADTGTPAEDTGTGLQAACSTSLTACAANCLCNNAILTALMCSEPDASLAMSCFTTALTAIATADPTDENAVGQCLITNSTPATDAGDAATTTTTDAGDAATTTTDAGDGG